MVGVFALVCLGEIAGECIDEKTAGLGREAEDELIGRALDGLRSLSGRDVTGWLSPARNPAIIRAPTAPTDAASVGVATPPRMAPSTATIRRTGGRTTLKISLLAGRAIVSLAAGMSPGRSLPRMAIYKMYRATRTRPGRMAEAKTWPTDSASTETRRTGPHCCVSRS